MAVTEPISHKRVHHHVTEIAKHLDGIRAAHGDLAPGQVEITEPTPAQPTERATP